MKDDLEITRKCAEACGIHLCAPDEGFPPFAHKVWPDPDDNKGVYVYDPLHDDAQLLSLGRKFPYEFEKSVIEWCNHLRRNEAIDLARLFCKRIADGI